MTYTTLNKIEENTYYVRNHISNLASENTFDKFFSKVALDLKKVSPFFNLKIYILICVILI